MKVLVTGSSGMVGKHVVAYLADNGHEPIRTDIVGGDRSISIRELAALIKELTMNSASELVMLPRSEHEREPQVSYPSVEKVKKLLGYTYEVSLEEGLKRTIEYTERRQAKLISAVVLATARWSPDHLQNDCCLLEWVLEVDPALHPWFSLPPGRRNNRDRSLRVVDFFSVRVCVMEVGKITEMTSGMIDQSKAFCCKQSFLSIIRRMCTDCFVAAYRWITLKGEIWESSTWL